MPIYEYECEACGNRFELIQKFSDPPVDVCPKCGERKVRKLLSSPAIQFKGSGWYITDYARKGGEGGGEKSGTETSKTETKPSESKSADKPSSDKDKSSSTSSNSSSTSSTSDKASSAPTTPKTS